jgi:hypothetical protein
VAAFFAAAALENSYQRYGAQSTLDKLRQTFCYFPFMLSPAAAVGALRNQHVLGMLCGVASFLAVLLGDEFLF